MFLSIASATVANAPRYVDSATHFSFVPPGNWERKPNVPAPAAAFIGPRSGGFATNIVVNVYSGPFVPAEEEKRVQSVQVQYGTIFSMGTAKLGGEPAHSWRTRLHVPGFPALENHQIFCLHSGHAVEITLTAPPTVMKKVDPVFDRVLASFRWEDKKPDKPLSTGIKKDTGH